MRTTELVISRSRGGRVFRITVYEGCGFGGLRTRRDSRGWMQFLSGYSHVIFAPHRRDCHCHSWVTCGLGPCLCLHLTEPSVLASLGEINP